MSNEQWLIYLLGIYPDSFLGELMVLSLVSVLGLVAFGFLYLHKSDAESKGAVVDTHLFYKCKKYLLSLPILFVFIFIISKLLPPKEYFIAIVVTPYLVEGGKTLLEQLEDPSSKLYKLNQIVDFKLNEITEKVLKPTEKDIVQDTK